MDQAQLKLALCRGMGRSKDYVDFLKSAHGDFILLKSGSVLTGKQLEICYNASRNIVEKNSRYHDLSAVMMMLLSGEQQIGAAIEKIGIGDGDSEFLVAFSDELDLERFSELNSIDTVSLDTGIPEDNIEADMEVFPRITDIIYTLNRSH